jgi:hypothetical protein
MTKVADTRKHHRQPQAVGSINHFLVSNGTSWLNNGGRPGSGNFFHTVREREEGV